MSRPDSNKHLCASSVSICESSLGDCSSECSERAQCCPSSRSSCQVRLALTCVAQYIRWRATAVRETACKQNQFERTKVQARSHSQGATNERSLAIFSLGQRGPVIFGTLGCSDCCRRSTIGDASELTLPSCSKTTKFGKKTIWKYSAPPLLRGSLIAVFTSRSS